MPQRFRVKMATIATTRVANKAIVTHMPAMAEILLLDELPPVPQRNRNEQVSVEWDGRRFRMFVVDILERCERVAIAGRADA